MSEEEVRTLVKIRIKQAGSLRELARQWAVSPAMLSDLMNGRRGPGPKILGPLNLRRVVTVTYQPASQRKGKRAS